jgi:DNA-binding transcriptional MerR regulator
MRMEKRKFRIGELAKRLKLERFVVRFWEKEFGLRTSRSMGKQRFYSEEDFSKFERIKQLLYHEGFTIAGAKQQLTLEKNSKPIHLVPSFKTTMDLSLMTQKEEQIMQLNSQITVLKEKLLKLSQLLQR